MHIQQVSTLIRKNMLTQDHILSTTSDGTVLHMQVYSWRTTTSAQRRCCDAKAKRSASASVLKTPSKDSAKNSCADSMYDASLHMDITVWSFSPNHRFTSLWTHVRPASPYVVPDRNNVCGGWSSRKAMAGIRGPSARSSGSCASRT